MLGIEVLCIALFSHVVSTLNATAAVLVAVLTMLFISSLVLPMITPRYVSARQLVAPVMWLAAVAICLVPALFMVVTDDLRRSYDGFGNSVLFVATIVTSVMAMAGPAVLTAVWCSRWPCPIFPPTAQRVALLGHGAVGEWSGRCIGRRACESCVDGPSWVCTRAFAAVGLMYAVTPLAVAAMDRHSRSWITLSLSVAAIADVWCLSATRLPVLPVVGQQESARVLTVDSGPDGVMTVVER